MLLPFIEKTRLGYAGLTVRAVKSGANKGQLVEDLVPMADRSYRAPPLSPLGELLLSSVQW